MASLPGAEGKKRPHAASVIINSGESATFNVTFRPTVAQRSQASVKLTVVNNQVNQKRICLVLFSTGWYGSMCSRNLNRSICEHMSLHKIFV